MWLQKRAFWNAAAGFTGPRGPVSFTVGRVSVSCTIGRDTGPVLPRLAAAAGAHAGGAHVVEVAVLGMMVIISEALLLLLW